MNKKKSIIFLVVFFLFIITFSGCVTEPSAHIHSLNKVDAVEATCTMDGNIEYYQCEECGKKFSDAEGSEEISESVIIPATGHKLQLKEGYDADCEHDGQVTYYVCDNCGKFFSDDAGENEIQNTVIQAKGHLLEYIPAQEADCGTMTNGHIAYYVCKNGCGKKFVKVDEETDGALQIAVEDGSKIFVIEKPESELTIFPEHSYQNGVCENCGYKKDTSSDGLLYELSADNESYVVSGIGTCTDTTIFISGEYNGKPVTEIKSEAFKDEVGIKAVVFVVGKSLGTYIEKIGVSAFEGCIGLESCYLTGGSDEKGNPYGLKVIGENAFKGCENLVITYEGSQREWNSLSLYNDLNDIQVVFKSLEIVIPIG